MSINSLIIDTLKPLAPIDLHEYTGTATTYMTFFTYNQRAGLIADNDEKTTVYSVQIDIYGKGNIEKLAKQVKEALKPHGFSRTHEMDLYDTDTKVFRKVISLRVAMGN